MSPWAGVAACLIAVLAAPAADAESLLGPSVEVLAPHDVTRVPHASLEGIACTATRACVAVGSYENTSREAVPMVALEAPSGWSRAATVPLPSNHAHAYSASGLAGVACPAKGSCLAVGSYEDASRNVLPLLTAQVAGAWGAGFTIGLPATAGGNQLASLSSVSCVSVGFCTAVGAFTDQHSTPMLMAASSTSGTWDTATQIALPAGAGTVQRALGTVGLTSVFCADAKDCVAVGSFLDAAGAIVPLHVVEVNGTWRRAIRAALAKGSAVVGTAPLEGVSCSAIGDCVAVGSATTTANRLRPVIERESSGTWGQLVAIGLPNATPAAAEASLEAVFCKSHGTCTAVGRLTTADGTVVPIVLVDSGGHWQPLQRLTSLPTAHPHPSFAALAGVSCPTTKVCAAAGSLGAVNASGTVTNSTAMATRIIPVRAIVDPAPPSHVKARPGPGRLRVTWVPGSDGGSAISEFTAMATPHDGSCTSRSSACTIAGLKNATSYAVVVTATNAHGTSLPSAPSERAVPGIVPRAPSGLRVARSHDRAVLRWRASTTSPGDPVTRYMARAFAAGAPARACSTTTTSCALGALTRGVSYTVWVVATNAVGASPRSASLRFRSL